MSYEKLEKLILDAKRGDNQAFEVLFERYWHMTYYCCYKYLQNEKDAEDATQEVFITLHRRIRNLKYPEFFAKTVRWIAAEVSRNYTSQKQRVADLGVPMAIEEVEDTLPEEKEEFLPVELLERKELKQELIDLIDRLPEKQREAVMLYYFNEMSQPEIAALTSSRLSAVSDRLYNARRTLKTQINESLEKGEMGAMVALPVLTQVFQEEMATMATTQVKEKIWSGLRTRLAIDPTATPTKPSNAAARVPESASWLKAVAGGAAVTTAACAAVVGVNLYQDFNPLEQMGLGPETAALIEQSERSPAEDILADLKQIDGPDSFQAFLDRYEVTDQAGTITSNGLACAVYRKEWEGLVILIGCAENGEHFQLAYTVTEDAEGRQGQVLPTDPENWILENLK